MPIETDYITTTLRNFENEGKARRPALKGYVPNNGGVAIGKSGVTIATGVDLGQQTLEGLIKMGVPQTLAARLAPYIGLKKQDAINKLANLPLTISEDTASTIDDAVGSAYTRDTARRFNGYARNNAAPDWRFEDRPKQVQAVAVSLEYQLGPGNAAGYVRHLANGDYHAVIAALRAATSYARRRKAEADMIAEVV